MKKLVKTRTGKKLHVANGAYIYCGHYPASELSIITGEVSRFDICARCSKGMDVSQFGIENVTIKDA